ncbi:MAG TPA: hypothetical protein VFO58_09035 [Vicinamibacterales bacterium]|nr:hypothetical protein [Vicinamibacterales bacterium]
MTAIAIWLNDEEPKHPTLWIVADSRISGASAAPLIEDGAKIFSLPVVCRAPGQDGFFSRISYTHSFGYCFAGSTLMGQNAYLALVPLLGNLAARADYVPSMADVASYVHRYLLHTFDDFKSKVGESAMFEVAIFGHCGRTNRLTAFHVEPGRDEAGTWTLKCSEREDIQVGHPLYLGADKSRMMERFAAALGSAAPGRPLSRMPRYVIQDCISDESLPSIGGDVQLGIANSFGFRALALVKPRVYGKPEAYISYLGRELTPDLAQLGEALVAGPAMVG